MDPTLEGKRAAGRRAADLVEDGMVVGLGTGSTVHFVLERLAERVREEGLRIRGVPTSEDTRQKAGQLGIPLTDLEETAEVDLAVDGADEINPAKHMIKGGGGALVREKIVAAASREMVVVVTPEKVVERLGLRTPVPVEVLPFGWRQAGRRLEELGCKALLRTRPDGARFTTDNGNLILDCRFEGVADPAGMEHRIKAVPGVVDNGLFVAMAGRVVTGHPDGATEVW